MKQKSIKNYIAFTLTEMTLVLLIMSVLAAVLTPAITKTISNNAKSLPAEVVVSPWKNITTSYPYNGMYNLGGFNYSMVSIGYRPLSTHTSYRSPALLLRARNGANKTNIYTSPQIALFKSDSLASSPVKFGLDNNDNIHLGYINFYNVSNAISQYGNVGSVFIGNHINDGNSATGYSTRSVYIGNSISQPYGSLNSVNIGASIASHKYNSSNVVVGSDIDVPYSVNITQRDSILIGYMTGARTVNQYDVKIGNSAGSIGSDCPVSITNSYGNIAIGPYSRYFSTKDSTKTVKIDLQNDISIGYYAGSFYKDVGSSGTSSVNINIGVMSGSKLQVRNNINIGRYAGWYLGTSIGPITYDSINIGEYAGANYGTKTNNSIAIGRYAAYNQSEILDNNISIGEYAGASAIGSYNSIFIGANSNKGIAKSGYTSDNAIIIGYSTRSGSWFNGVYDSIRLGASTTLVDTWQNNVAIGFNACGASGISNKVCIGAYSGISPVSSGAWSHNNTPQTFIGDEKFTMAANYITLYAAHIFAPASTPTAISDRRLKENIVPSKHSLNDIRKVNIYNYNMKNDKTKSPHIGVIAQEHKKIFPHAVSKHPTFKHYTVSAEWVNFTAVNAVKEIDKNVQQLQKNVKQFIKDFLGLKSRVQQLETKLAKLQKENKEIKAHLNKINAKLN